MKNYFLSILSLFVFGTFTAQSYKKPLVSAIKEADLRKDMYDLAADQFLGREAGTLDELKVSMWLADRAKDAGMKPAGDNGTFFQFFDMYRHQIIPQSTLKIGDNSLKLWKDFLVAEPVNANIDSEIVYAGNAEPEDLSKLNIKGKILAVNASDKNIEKEMTLFVRRYPGFVRTKYYSKAVESGAKGIIFITDETSDKSWVEALPQMTRGSYGVEGLRESVTNNIPVLWIKKENSDWVKNNPKISLHLITETYKYPSVNII